MTQEPGLPIAVVGCDFRVASSRWRARLVLDPTEALHLAGELAKSCAADGFVDLNTCNRTEWIVSAAQPAWAAQLLRSHMLARLGPSPQRPIAPYVFVGEDAARHLFRVVMGSESLVVGERQIAGQFFRAFEIARDRGTASRILNGISSISGRVVRSAGRCGCLAAGGKGVHTMAINRARRWLAERGLQEARLAVIGQGEIGRKARGLIEADGQLQAVPCNRTVGDDERGVVRPLSELGQVLAEVDAAIVCTGAPTPTVRPEHVAARAAGAPLLLVDLGIPEQVEREGLGPAVERIGLDELVAAVQRQRGVLQNQAETEQLVARAVDQYRRFCSEPDFIQLLESMQQNNRRLMSEEIPRLVSAHFADLPEELCARLTVDLRAILLNYSHSVFGAIKDAARRRAEHTPGEEP